MQVQQILVEAPPLDVARGGVAERVFALAQRLAPVAGTAGEVDAFDAVLDAALAAGMDSWVVDWAAIVCGDASLASEDPQAARLLSADVLCNFCGRAAAALAGQLKAYASAAAPTGDDPEAELAWVSANVDALEQIARAVAATGGSRTDLAALLHRLQLMRQAAQALAYCLASGVDPAKGPRDDHIRSRAVWQRAVEGRRAAAPGGRLFLDDLLAAASDAAVCPPPGAGGPTAKAGQATRSAAATAATAAATGSAYPWASPAAAVEALFGGDGADGAATADEAARRRRLALFFYFLADGGWLGADGRGPITARGFASAFHLRPGLVAQWQAQALLDRAAGGAGGADAALTRACDLLLGCANAATPFRLVEALAVAGQPAAALAVQRARGSADGGGLNEGRVLLAARLECGLLYEAHAGLGAHCSQLASQHDRASHLEALMTQLLEWCGARDDERRQAAGDAALAGGSAGGWLQQVAQLPLNSAEERLLAAWIEARAAAGAPDGDLLPLYLLQRGRVLEAMAAYARWRDSPSAAAAAANPAAAARAAQLKALMSAAATALPPCLRGAALPGHGDGSARRLVSGLDAAADATAGATRLLVPRGAEPPVFLGPVVPPAPMVAPEEAAAGEPELATPAGVESDAAAQDAMALDAVSDGQTQATANPPVPLPGGLLFGVPAAPSGSLFGAPSATAGLATSAGGSAALGGAGSIVSEAEFRQQLLGLPASSQAAPATRGRPATRSSKRQRH